MLLKQILTQWRCPVASSEAIDLLHWAIRAVSYHCITIAIKTASKVGVFFIIVLLFIALGMSSCLMAASRGFQCSPGHAALDNVLQHIASMRPHGHQNGPRWRYICLLLLPFLFD
jgi:hypothetical protein